MIERLRQRIRYFPYWLWNFGEYQRSERWRRAMDLIIEDIIEDDLVGVDYVIIVDRGSLHVRYEPGEEDT